MNQTQARQAEVESPVPITANFSLFTWLLIALFVISSVMLAITVVLAAIKAVSPSTVPASSSGALLYASRFDSYPQEWLPNEGADYSKITDNSLHIFLNTVQNGIYSTLVYDFGDFDARMNVTRLAAADDYSEAGMLFRFHDKFNYLMFKIRGDGYYRIERRKDGQLDVLSEWHASTAVLPGLNAVNQLRVVGQGNTFKFFVNGEPLVLCPNGPQKQKSTWNGDKCMSNNQQTSASLKDDSFSAGKIGAGAAAESGAGIEVAFSDVLVYQP